MKDIEDQLAVVAKALVGVEWADSCGRPGIWNSHEDIADLTTSVIYSVGWVIAETKKDLIIAAHVSPGQSSGEMCIPKCSILRRRNLGRFPAKKGKK